VLRNGEVDHVGGGLDGPHLREDIDGEGVGDGRNGVGALERDGWGRVGSTLLPGGDGVKARVVGGDFRDGRGGRERNGVSGEGEEE